MPATPIAPPPRHEAALMTADELAERAGLSGQTVWRMAQRGQIPGVIRLGRRVLFSRARVERWLAGEAIE